MVDLIRTAGRGSYMFCCDIARAYKQLPLDPADWQLICLKAQGKYFVDVSLSFGLHWAAACCQNVTTLINRALKEEGIEVLSCIDDFGRVAQDKNLACRHFKQLRTKLQQLGLQEALHKAAPPATNIVWLGLEFDYCSMTVSIP